MFSRSRKSDSTLAGKRYFDINSIPSVLTALCKRKELTICSAKNCVPFVIATNWTLNHSGMNVKDAQRHLQSITLWDKCVSSCILNRMISFPYKTANLRTKCTKRIWTSWTRSKWTFLEVGLAIHSSKTRNFQSIRLEVGPQELKNKIVQMIGTLMLYSEQALRDTGKLLSLCKGGLTSSIRSFPLQ